MKTNQYDIPKAILLRSLIKDLNVFRSSADPEKDGFTVYYYDRIIDLLSYYMDKEDKAIANEWLTQYSPKEERFT